MGTAEHLRSHSCARLQSPERFNAPAIRVRGRSAPVGFQCGDSPRLGTLGLSKVSAMALCARLSPSLSASFSV